MAPDAQQPHQERFEIKLVRSLLARKLVSTTGIDKALRQQVVLGGHLATNLWELRLVEGSTLSLISAEILEVPAADPGLMAKVQPVVLNLLPLDFVETARILPFRISGPVLQVATSEPWDLLQLGETAYHSGYPVQPYFMAEVPLMAFMQKLYGIAPSADFQLRAKRAMEHAPTLTRGKRALKIAPRKETLRQTVVQPLKRTAVKRKPAPATQQPLWDLKAAQSKLENAATRNEVGMVLLRFALSKGKRAALFVRRGKNWAAWMGAGEGVDPEMLRSLLFPAVPGTIFGLVAETGGHYLGSVKTVPLPLLKALGGQKKPRSVGLFPVQFGGKLVFGVYLDGGPGKYVATDVAEIFVLAQQVPAALEGLVQKGFLDKGNEAR